MSDEIKKARVVLFKPSGKYYTEEEWRIPENAIGPYDMERSSDFRRIEGGSVLIESQEPWGFPHLFPASQWAPVVKAEKQKRPERVACENEICGHTRFYHKDDGPCAFDKCYCPEFTKAEQSSSCLRSAQSEHSPQYEEHQASCRSQCKDQHVHTVVNRLAHMANTLESNRPEELESAMELLSRTWLALYLCEAIECQAFHTLVEQAQSNLLPALRSFLHTHKGPPSSDGQ